MNGRRSTVWGAACAFYTIERRIVLDLRICVLNPKLLTQTIMDTARARKLNSIQWCSRMFAHQAHLSKLPLAYCQLRFCSRHSVVVLPQCIKQPCCLVIMQVTCKATAVMLPNYMFWGVPNKHAVTHWLHATTSSRSAPSICAMLTANVHLPREKKFYGIEVKWNHILWARR